MKHKWIKQEGDDDFTRLTIKEIDLIDNLLVKADDEQFKEIKVIYDKHEEIRKQNKGVIKLSMGRIKTDCKQMLFIIEHIRKTDQIAEMNELLIGYENQKEKLRDSLNADFKGSNVEKSGTRFGLCTDSGLQKGIFDSLPHSALDVSESNRLSTQDIAKAVKWYPSIVEDFLKYKRTRLR